MGEAEQVSTQTSQDKGKAEQPRCRIYTEPGVKTAQDFAATMSALLSDVIAGRISHRVAASACNAGGKLLKVVEMQYKYGSNGEQPGQKVLKLVE